MSKALVGGKADPEYQEPSGRFKPGPGGSRFETCVKAMRAKGAKDPEALCAFIGRQAGRIP